MRALQRLAERIATFGAWLGGGLLLLAAAGICAEIVLRSAFAVSLGGMDEIGGYALAISSAWAFAYTLISRAHIRIDTAYLAMPRRLRALLDLLALGALIAFFAIVTWYGARLLLRTINIGARAMTPLATPLVLPQSLWVTGLVVFLLVALVVLVNTVIALAHGDLARAQRLAGSRSVGEELEDELERAPDRPSPRDEPRAP